MELELGTLAVDAVLVGIIVAIMQIVKRFIPSLVAPLLILVTVLMGVAVAFGRDALEGTFDNTDAITVSLIAAVIVKGAIAGLAAAGAYDITKSTGQTLGLVDKNYEIEQNRQERM